MTIAEVAARYARQSRGKADKSEASPKDQLDKTGEAALADGCSPDLKTYQDVGKSGWDPAAQRPGFERMMKDAAGRKFTRLYVLYLTRLTRLSPQESLPIVLQLWSYGITIVSVTEGEFRPNDFVSLLTVIVRLEGGNRESSNKSVAVRGVKQQARKLGGFVGGRTPFGLATRKVMREDMAIHLLTPDPTESKIIKAMVHRILNDEDVTIGQLADELTRSETPGRQTAGRKWDTTTVKRYLQDPRLAGYDATPLHADGGRHPTGYEYARDSESGVPLMLDFAPVVAPADWHQVQTWLATRTRGRHPHKSENLLSGSGILFCECGFRMVAFAPSGDNRRSYRCPRLKSDDAGRTHVGGNTISMRALDEYAARRIYARISTAEGDEESLSMLLEATRRYAKRTESPVTAGERQAAEMDQRTLTEALERLYDREKDPEFANPIGKRRWSEQVISLADRLSAVERQLRDITEAETPRLPIEQWMPEDPDADPVGPGSWWHSASMPDRRDFTSLFLSRLTVRKLEKHPGRPRVLDVRDRVKAEFVTLVTEE